MKLNQLRAVTAIAEKGSLREAARYLGMSQPALTHCIGALERELGATLFERRARGMAPTPVGELFIRRARSIQSEAERAQDEVRQFMGVETGTVSVCLSFVAQLILLPVALPLFRQRYPKVRLQVMGGSYQAAQAQLRDGRVDFYVGPRPENPPPAELLVEKLFENTRLVFCRPGHPLAGARSLRELVDAQWISTGITEKAESEFGPIFAAHGLQAPELAMQVSSILSAIACLHSTGALTISARQLKDYPVSPWPIHQIPIREVIAAPDVVLVRRAALPLTPVADALCNCFQRAGLDYATGRRPPRRKA